MKKVVMFGAGNVGRNYFYNSNRKSEIIAVLDNNKELIGKVFEGTVPIIGMEEYVSKYIAYEIIITMVHFREAEKQLQSLNIYNYRIAAEFDRCSL